MELHRRLSTGGWMNGPATKPFRIQSARLSVNISPCATVEGVFGSLIGGRLWVRGVVAPDSKSVSDRCARASWLLDSRKETLAISAASWVGLTGEFGLRGIALYGNFTQKSSLGGNS